MVLCTLIFLIIILKLGGNSAMEKQIKRPSLHLRDHGVDILLRFTPQRTGISRLTQIHAISIFDRYLATLTGHQAQHHLSDDTLTPIVLSCLRLGAKFMGDKLPKIQMLGQLVNWKGCLQKLQAEAGEGQMKVFIAIKFAVGRQNAITFFEEKAEADNLSPAQSAYFLKVLLLSIAFSTHLSFNPSLGYRMYNLVVHKKADYWTKKYVRIVLNWNLASHQASRNIGAKE